MKYLFAMLLIGLVAGFLLAHVIGVEPRTVYKESHFFKDPVTVREGDTVWFWFECNKEPYGQSASVYEDGDWVETVHTYTEDPRKYFYSYPTIGEEK